MKKTLILALCFVLFACALCGCGKKNDNWLTVQKGILHVNIPMEPGVTWEDSIDDETTLRCIYTDVSGGTYSAQYEALKSGSATLGLIRFENGEPRDMLTITLETKGNKVVRVLSSDIYEISVD